MATIRQDLTTKEWVIFATERAKRPHDFVKRGSVRGARSSQAACPFFPGNEAWIPSEIFVLPNGDDCHWSVRSVSNKFAALVPDGTTEHKPVGSIYREMGGVGVHCGGEPAVVAGSAGLATLNSFAMALTKIQLRELYRKRAARYDFSANLYYLIGFREARCRNHAVSALALKPGDTVVEIGCGTGLNFSYLLRSIGENGRLIGVDLTDAMLEKARDRVERNRWHNVELVEADAAAYVFPAGIRGVLSTFALTLVPEYEQVIAHAAGALVGGGRLVIADFKKPDRWPLWLVKTGVWLIKPFGVSLDLTERKPWQVMTKYFANVTVTESFGDSVYIAVGERR